MHKAVNLTLWTFSFFILGCEVSHKILRTDSALSTIKQVYQRFGAGSEAVRAIRRALIGAIVISTYNNKTYRIDDVDFGSSPLSKLQSNSSKNNFASY